MPSRFEVRQAALQPTEVMAIADLVTERAKGKVTDHTARSRVQACVLRSIQRSKQFRAALVAVHGDRVVGFVYAEEANLFDLCHNIRVAEVRFLVGAGAVYLMKRLRAMTKLRIHVCVWALLGRPAVFRRLLRSLAPEPVAIIYQV